MEVSPSLKSPPRLGDRGLKSVAKRSPIKRLLTNGGVQRGLTPLPGVWGCPPNLKSPKIGGQRGLKSVAKRSHIESVDKVSQVIYTINVKLRTTMLQ